MPSAEDKKKFQLGMHHGTAGNRLVKDLLFYFISKTDDKFCYRCGEELSRESFTIEHKTPWLDSDNTKDLFFDLDNISFSHIWCNSSASRSVGNRGQILLRRNDDKRRLKLETYVRPYKRKIKQDELNFSDCGGTGDTQLT